MQNTRIYLLYNNEKIDEYLSDPRIFPLKLEPQGEFFESEAFRMLNMSDIPSEIEYIGFITPSFFRKTRLTLKDITPPRNRMNILGLVATHDGGKSYIDHGIQRHGPIFRIIWNWLIEGLGYNPSGITYKHFNVWCNMWVLSRNNFAIYLEIAKKAVNLLVNAPPHIKSLLFSDSGYDEGKLSSEQLIKLCGTPHYPFHPFIMERLIPFVCDRYNWILETV